MDNWTLVIDESRNDYYAGDWCVLLHNDESVWEGHSNNAKTLLRAVLGEALNVATPAIWGSSGRD